MKSAKKLQTIHEAVVPPSLQPGISLTLPPLRIRWALTDGSRADLGIDAILHVAFEEREHTFVAEYQPDWTQRAFQASVDKALRLLPASLHGVHPLVTIPYLSEERLSELESLHLSGLDLCGNGTISIPGIWLVRRSGQPNRFRRSVSSSGVNPYHGRASLIARTLLQQPQFRQLDDLHAEIERRGGAVSMALASRAVKELESELILVREAGMRIRLVQPQKLLDRLDGAFKSPDLSDPAIYRVDLPTTELLPRLFHASEAHGARLSMTGLGSVSHHVSMAIENVVKVYSDEGETLIEGVPIKPGERFANLEVHKPRDPLVYFDSERDAQGIVWASPVQTYLEMTHASDARLQEGAQNLRSRILSELEQKGAK